MGAGVPLVLGTLVVVMLVVAGMLEVGTWTRKELNWVERNRPTQTR